MSEVYIIDVICILCGKGKKDGLLYEVKLIMLLIILLNELKDCYYLDIFKVDDIVLGCVMFIVD